MDGDFSKRMGLESASDIIQLDDMNTNLRNGLWNALTEHYLEKYRSEFRSLALTQGSNLENLAKAIHTRFFKKRRDKLPVMFQTFVDELDEFFENAAWHRVYSLIEFIAAFAPNLNINSNYSTSLDDFISDCNTILQTENSAYRIVGEKIMQITSAEEITEINSALATKGFPGVNTHLQTALAMLTDRENPDYRNSIKESISAVESLTKKLTGNPNATLGTALVELEKHHDLHPALKKSFASLYGWTSDAEGIRHALMDVSTLTHADARFMLITCSAFTNFVIDSTKE